MIIVVTAAAAASTAAADKEDAGIGANSAVESQRTCDSGVCVHENEVVEFGVIGDRVGADNGGAVKINLCRTSRGDLFFEPLNVRLLRTRRKRERQCKNKRKRRDDGGDSMHNATRGHACARARTQLRERPRGRRDSRCAAHHFFFSFVFSTPFSHNVFKPFTACQQISAQANISLREHRRDYSPMSNRCNYTTKPFAWGKFFRVVVRELHAARYH